jgi:hypothetical protein
LSPTKTHCKNVKKCSARDWHCFSAGAKKKKKTNKNNYRRCYNNYSN